MFFYRLIETLSGWEKERFGQTINQFKIAATEFDQPHENFHANAQEGKKDNDDHEDIFDQNDDDDNGIIETNSGDYDYPDYSAINSPDHGPKISDHAPVQGPKNFRTVLLGSRI